MNAKVRPLKDIERDAIRDAMTVYGPDRKREAAHALGISLKTLYTKLHAYGLGEFIKGWGRA